MKTKILIPFVFLLAICSSLALTQITSAIAQGENETSNSNQNETTQTRTRTTSEIKEAIATRLEAGKLAICKKHEASINNVISRVADRDQKRLNLFTTTLEKVQAFYTKNNLTVANYDQLLATVQEKKTAAQITVDSTVGAKVTFACDGDNPKGIVSSFKNSHSSSATALSEYKDSVRSLLKEVKTAAALKNTNTEGEN